MVISMNFGEVYTYVCARDLGLRRENAITDQTYRVDRDIVMDSCISKFYFTPLGLSIF
jgi:hypothetical protein